MHATVHKLNLYIYVHLPHSNKPNNGSKQTIMILYGYINSALKYN